MPGLTQPLRPDQPTTQKLAACALLTLAKASQPSRNAIIAAGAVPLLPSLLQSGEGFVDEIATAEALQNLASGSYSDKNAIIAAGALPMLVAILRSGQPRVHKPVADASNEPAVGSRLNNPFFLRMQLLHTAKVL